MKKITWVDRLRYTFDNTMSHGPAGLIIWLALVSVILILAVMLIVAASGADPNKSNKITFAESDKIIVLAES